MDEDIKPQGGNGKPQGGEPKKSDAPQGGVEDKVTDSEPGEDRLSRENARRRLENETLKRELAELREELDAQNQAKMTDTERQTEAQKRLEKKVAEAERRAIESERLLHSARASQKYELPDVLSELLRGETSEEVEEHAKLVSAALEKHYRVKFQGAIPPNPEGGDKSRVTTGANGHMDERTRNQKLRETASSF